jgi:hypothetical protein
MFKFAHFHDQLLGCDFGDLSLSNSMTAAIDRGSQPRSTYPVNPNAGADIPINRQHPPAFPKHQTAAQLLPEHYAATQLLPERPPVSQHPPIHRPPSLEDEICELLQRTCTADDEVIATSAKLITNLTNGTLMETMINPLGPSHNWPVDALIQNIFELKGKYARNAFPSASTASMPIASSPSTPRSYKNTPHSASASPRCAIKFI